MLQAEIALDTERTSIEAFAEDYRRKNPARTRALPSGDDELARVVLTATPRFLRADGFHGFRPVILHAADLLDLRADTDASAT